MEIGVYSFGNVQRNADGTLRSTAEAIRNLLEAIRLADEVGLDYFGVGEHHTRTMPVSSPGSVLAAAGAVTAQIRLGSTVTVLGTDDPVRVYQQHATASAISRGRVDITVGRGSSTDTFPLFGYNLADYDRLFAEKLQLLMSVNEADRTTWSSTTRAPLDDLLVVPRVEGRLKIWLGTGGSPESSIRAGLLGLPIAYGILGGTAPHWVRQAALYWEAAERSDHGVAGLEIAVATHGFVANNGNEAKESFHRYETTAYKTFAKERGFQVRDRPTFDADAALGGMIFAGSPSEIAHRLITLHHQLGHSRHILQMDLGHIPQREYLEAIELLGTVVAPQIRSEIGAPKTKT
jgi:alkanesulfonate monooxygenase SsuD/methylene tetrahydromethanopterin reductase-like flavin-dependent oxidoreductase (luciferase family)